MNCQVRARLILRRNCFGVVGPTLRKILIAISIVALIIVPMSHSVPPRSASAAIAGPFTQPRSWNCLA